MRSYPQLDEHFFQAFPGVTIADSGIRLLVIPTAVSKQLEVQFDIRARITYLRAETLKNTGHREVFVQKTFALSRLQPAKLLVVVTISLLATKDAWRGGWFMSLVPVGEEELFAEYLREARESVVAGLRAERASGGSWS
jgi:hypothetical protein